MLVHATWVLPVSTSPLRDGAVLVRHGRIAELGPLDALTRSHPYEPVERHDGCVLTPGLVNAHTHLGLTVLGGIVPSAPFSKWLPLVVRAMRALSPRAREASVALGAARCLQAGVTVVGEIAYGAHSRVLGRAAGLGGVFFAEVLGIDPVLLPAALAEAGYSAAADPDGRTRGGISPHSPYTSGPALLRATTERARADGVACAIHVAESRAETVLFAGGGGALADTAGRSAFGLEPGAPTTPVAHLDSLGVLEGALAIHCVHVTADDIARLATAARGVVLCPRSNAYLHEGPAPVAALERAGVRLALGTDSAASNVDLDLMEDARAVHRLARDLGAERITRMVTEDGAAALGVGAAFGTLAPGRHADLAAFRCADAAHDPYEAFLGGAGSATLVSVISAGRWRVRDGSLLA